MIYKCYHSSANGLPLGSQINPKKFKVYSIDSGLCLRLLGLELGKLMLEKKTLLENRGPLAEQWVAQQILSSSSTLHHKELFYWHRELKSAQAEVDFLIQENDHVLPLEVKSKRQRGLKSLGIFLEEKKDFARQAWVISEENLQKTPQITTLPFYLLGTFLSQLG